MNSLYLLVPVLLPLVCGLLLTFFKGLDRRGHMIYAFTVLAVTVASLIPVLLVPAMELQLFAFSETLPVFLKTDAPGKYFAAVMAFLWLMSGIHSFEYFAHDNHTRRYYAFYLCTLGVLMGLCFAGSLVTYYMFYELMTLLTVPLVMHTMEKRAVAAGIKYLIYSVIGASLVLAGVFILVPYVESFSFKFGGVLDLAKVSGNETTVLVTLFLMIIGFGTKAGMFPLHGWLPTAHPEAPAPASAVLSGIITKAGVLGLFRLVYCFAGADFIRGTWVQTAWMSLTLFTVFMGSLLALRENVLKKRLAYSSVSQVSYVLFGLSTLTPVGVLGAFLHVAAHALIKNTLFLSAGAVIHQTGKTEISGMEGIGKRMPAVMWCFTIASIGLIGIPPCLGFFSKWNLAQGALSMTGVPDFFRYLGPAVLLASAIMTAGYLLSVSIRAFFPKKPIEEGRCEPGFAMLFPLIVLAALSVILGIFPGALTAFIHAIAASVL